MSLNNLKNEMIMHNMEKQIVVLKQQLSKTQADLKLAVEALEFYSKHTHWLGVPRGYSPDGTVWSSIVHNDLEFLEIDNGEVGGKLARQTLKQIKEKGDE